MSNASDDGRTQAPPGRERATALVWGVIATLICLAVSGYDASLLEEGMFLHVGQRLASGEVLYRDVVVFTGPLPFEILAFFYRLLGVHIWVGRVLIAVLTGFSAALAYSLARRSNAGAPAHVAAATIAVGPCLLFPLMGFYYYTTIALHLSIVAGYAALRGTVSTRWALVAGVIVAAVALCKQTNGAVLAPGLAIAIALGCERGRLARNLGAYVAGGVVSAVLTLAYYGSAGALGDLVRAIVVLPLSLDSTFESPLPNFWPPGELSDEIYARRGFYLPYFFVLLDGFAVHAGPKLKLLTQVAYALPFFTIGVLLLRLAFRDARAEVAVQLAVGLAWVINLFPRADWGHLVHVLPVMMIAWCVLLGGAPIVRRVVGQRIIGFIAAGTCAALFGGAAWAYSTIAAESSPPIASRLPVRPVTPGLAEGPFPEVIDYILRNTDPGDPIFVPRSEPLLYFATETRNPTPYPGVIPGMRDEQQDLILEGLSEVRYVLMSEIDQPAMTYYSRELPRVVEYFERYFAIAEGIEFNNWLAVYERGEDRGEKLYDFIEHADDARAFVRPGPQTSEPGAKFERPVASRGNRRVLAFLLGAHGGGVDYRINIPLDARFTASVGQKRVTALGGFLLHPDHGAIVVSIRSGDDGPFKSVATKSFRELPPASFWEDLDVDLSAYAGQEVTLRLELTAEKPIPPGRRVGYLGSPTIRRSSR